MTDSPKFEETRCPFCFNDDVEAQRHEGTARFYWFVECSRCFARGPVKPTRKAAEAAWKARFIRLGSGTRN